MHLDMPNRNNGAQFFSLQVREITGITTQTYCSTLSVFNCQKDKTMPCVHVLASKAVHCKLHVERTASTVTRHQLHQQAHLELQSAVQYSCYLELV